MKIVMFSFSLLVLLCMTMILCNSIIKDGPLYMTGIVLTSAMFIFVCYTCSDNRHGVT